MIVYVIKHCKEKYMMDNVLQEVCVTKGLLHQNTKKHYVRKGNARHQQFLYFDIIFALGICDYRVLSWVCHNVDIK